MASMIGFFLAVRYRSRPKLARDRGLVFRQKAPVVLGDHVRCVLDGVTGLLVGSGLLEDMGGENVSDVMRPVGQKALDHTATCVRVVDAVSLDGQAPHLVERVLVVGGIWRWCV